MFNSNRTRGVPAMAAKKSRMTEDHKQALAVGRDEGRMIGGHRDVSESSPHADPAQHREVSDV